MPFLVANGIKLHYHVYGEGEPILWIQGLGADHSAWLAQVTAFRSCYRCVVFDNRDVGHSDYVREPYTLADMADDAAGLLTALDLQRAHVVGLSMGAGIAQELGLKYPDRVRSLVLGSSAAKPDARMQVLLAAWSDIYRKAGMVDFYRQGLPWLFSYRFFERPRSVAAMLRYVAAHPQPADAFARQVAAGMRQDTSSRLPLLRLPTLVVAGDEDILVPARLSRALAEQIPGAQFTVIPGAAHAITTEQPAQFNQVVDGFLSAHRAQPQAGC